jgi:hypothetical protein
MLYLHQNAGRAGFEWFDGAVHSFAAIVVCRKVLAATSVFFLLAISIFFIPGAMAEDIVLPGSKIRYPGGFDPNTVGEIQGTATDFSFTGDGPVSFQIKFSQDTYLVLVSPKSSWSDELTEDLKEGAYVRVIGSKTLGADGRLYMIAQDVEVPQTGRKFSFRSEKGSPLWSPTTVQRKRGAGSLLRGFFNK